MDANPLEVPQSDGEDVAHMTVSTVLGLIPFVGAGELFKFIVTPSLEKRREQWMQVVADAIRELQNRKVFDVNSLLDNEEFITLLLQATQAAFKTHSESKHKLLKQALVSAMVTSVVFDTKQLYIDLVDRLTPSHIAVLLFVDSHKQFTGRMTSADQLYELMNTDESIDLQIEPVPFLAFLGDLEKIGLLVRSDNFLIMDADVHRDSFLLIGEDNKSELPRIDVTDLARHFLNFIGL